jgi:hemerythrin superfamily protein
MARSTPTRSTDAPRDAIALLKGDHRAVEQLFEEFEEADDEQLGAIAQRVCQMLTVHAQIEEEILYPQALEAFEDEEETELVHEAEVEHASAKDLIAKIEGMTIEDESFKATVKVLSEYIKHHVKEEETEMFPKLKKAELDLKDLGAQLATRKMELMEQIGIEEEAEPTAPRKRATSRAKTSTRAKARSGARRSASRSSNSRSARH